MAAWQADIVVVLKRSLPLDYRARLARVLPAGVSWSREIEMWGTEEGDRIDVVGATSDAPEVLARFDMRAWRPAVYRAFVEFVTGVEGRLQAAWDDGPVPLAVEQLERRLQESDAAWFVRDPRSFLEYRKAHPIQEA